MGLLDFFRKRSDGSEFQAAVGGEMARSVMADATGRDAAASRRLAARVAVFCVVAERIDRPEKFFDPFFARFWETLIGSTVHFASKEELFEEVDRAAVVVARGALSIEPRSQLKFGQDLAQFIDPTLDSRLASVGASLAIEFGGHAVAAADLLQRLPEPGTQ